MSADKTSHQDMKQDSNISLCCDPVSTIALHDSFAAIGIKCETTAELAVATVSMANAMQALINKAQGNHQ